MFLVKYNSSGARQWTKQLGTSNNEYASAIATDSSDNIYVTGMTWGGLDGSTKPKYCMGYGTVKAFKECTDIFLVKYNSSGTKQWVKQLEGSSKSFDNAQGLAVDSSDNIYVAGFTNGGLDGNTSSGKHDILLVKYNSGGSKQWLQQFGSSNNDMGLEVNVDSKGNIYVTGYTEGGLDGKTNSGERDIFLVKYNSSGTKQWTQQLGTPTFEEGNGVAVDSSDNIYVSGWTRGKLDTYAGGDDAILVKYNSSGTKQWTRQFGAPSFLEKSQYNSSSQMTTSEDKGIGVAVDSSGNIYVTGNTEGGMDGNTNSGKNDIFLVKYNSSGTKQWVKQLEGSSKSFDNAQGLAVDSSDNIYVAGFTNGGLDGNTSSGKHDILLVKYNSTGTKQWLQQFGSSKNDMGLEVTVDSSDNIYITGYTEGGLDGKTNSGERDIFLVKYNSSGTKQWTQQLGTPTFEEANGVAVDSSDNIYVTGWTRGKLDIYSGGDDTILVKYNSSGTKQWTRQFGAPSFLEKSQYNSSSQMSTSGDKGIGVAVDSSGNIYVMGNTEGGMDGNTNSGKNDIFLVKYNSM
jgi:uncharacterized delta-60 repeat protein